MYFIYLNIRQSKQDHTELSSFKYKQVIVVRSDLQMSKGKTAIQVAHASVLTSEKARKKKRRWWRDWLNEGQCKVALKVNGLTELEKLNERAEEIELPSVFVEDRGLTEIPPGTTTCLGIGPGPREAIDGITGDLPLL
jgi:PTH2 family peptidyl-tRNA hydrolase